MVLLVFFHIRSTYRRHTRVVWGGCARGSSAEMKGDVALHDAHRFRNHVAKGEISRYFPTTWVH
jgi:hypothetical protein